MFWHRKENLGYTGYLLHYVDIHHRLFNFLGETAWLFFLTFCLDTTLLRFSPLVIFSLNQLWEEGIFPFAAASGLVVPQVEIPAVLSGG